MGTEFKGSFNDPCLHTEEFDNYAEIHEIYAITLVICFIMTGKQSNKSFQSDELKYFFEIGTNIDKSKRFKNIEEVSEAFYSIKKYNINNM